MSVYGKAHSNVVARVQRGVRGRQAPAAFCLLNAWGDATKEIEAHPRRKTACFQFYAVLKWLR